MSSIFPDFKIAVDAPLSLPLTPFGASASDTLWLQIHDLIYDYDFFLELDVTQLNVTNHFINVQQFVWNSMFQSKLITPFRGEQQFIVNIYMYMPCFESNVAENTYFS